MFPVEQNKYVAESYLVIIVFQIQARRAGNWNWKSRAEIGEDTKIGHSFLRFWATICCQSKVSNARHSLSALLCALQTVHIELVLFSTNNTSHDSSALIGFNFASSCYCFRCLHQKQCDDLRLDKISRFIQTFKFNSLGNSLARPFMRLMGQTCQG